MASELCLYKRGAMEGTQHSNDQSAPGVNNRGYKYTKSHLPSQPFVFLLSSNSVSLFNQCDILPAYTCLMSLLLVL